MFCIVWQNKFSILFLKSYKFFKIWIVEHYLRYIQNLLKILPQTTTGSFPAFVEKKKSTSVQTKNGRPIKTENE